MRSRRPLSPRSRDGDGGVAPPETLIGPLFFLFTRLAAAGDASARCALADHLTVLAAHPAVDPGLRLAAGALAIEHRR